MESQSRWALGGLLLTGGLILGVCIALVSAVVIPMSDSPPGSCANGTSSVQVPEPIKPAVQRAADVSGLPFGYLAAMAKRESDFNPGVFAGDSNGGTWGLWQLNREEFAKHAPGQDPATRDPMVQADVTGRYLKARLEEVKKLQAAHKDTEWGKLPELDALTIAHNAGEGNLMKYPNLPPVTQSYLAEMRQNFHPAPCPAGGAPGMGIAPPSGKMVSPLGPGSEGVQMTAKYDHYPRGGPHWGVDLAKNPEGSWTVVSICDGTVAAVKINQAYANSNANGTSGSTNYVWIDCGNRIFIGYAHFYARDLNPALKQGVPIGAGTPLFKEGNQGNSSGPHLHLQVSLIGSMNYSRADTVDPAGYLAEHGIQLPKPNY